MNFGIFLAAQHSEGNPMDRLDEHVEQVRVAREAGFASVFAGQHYLSSPYQMLHPIPLLARVAAEAGDMFVGTGILLAAVHNPVEIADLAATMDAVCHGRFILGLGLGYRDIEYEAFGVPRNLRVSYLEESLLLLPKLWSGHPISHRSDRVHLDNAAGSSFPTRRPRPPIWLAANNDPAVARAARLADAWLMNPHATLTVLARQMKLFLAERARASKPAPAVVPLLKEVYCADSRKEAWADARPFLEEKYRTYVAWGQQEALPPNEGNLDLPFEALQGDRFIIGDPYDVIEQLEVIRQRLGVTHVVLRMQWAGARASLDQAKVLRSIRLIGHHVIPHFMVATGAGPDLGVTDADLCVPRGEP